ncbi:MAG: T9SS type A sorting domain-containing protein [Chlorobiota bacterium]|nr:MAG: T9SS type A sorting domain-containing protein [Chlorobiota bacterium]
MKKIIFLLGIFFCSIRIANAQPHIWKEVLNLDNNDHAPILYKGCILDSNSMIIPLQMDDILGLKGLVGTVLRTTNGGKTWDYLVPRYTIEATKETLFPRVADYVSKDDIFIGCHFNHILKTTNAGINWVVTSLPRFSTNNSTQLEDIAFLSMYDKNVGIALVDSEIFTTNTHLFSTTDSWKSFKEVKIPEGYFVAQSVAGSYRGFVKCLGHGVFLCKVLDKKTSKEEFLARTTNGGDSWQIIEDPLNSHIRRDSIQGRNFSFKDSLTGWCMGHVYPKDLLKDTTRGYLSKTINGGKTWEYIGEIKMPIDLDTVNKNRNTWYMGFHKSDDKNLQVATPLTSRLGKKGEWVIDTAQVYLYWTKTYFDLRFGAPNIFMRVNENVIIKDFGEYTPSGAIEEAREGIANLYPNPAQRLINIGLQGVGYGISEVILFNNMGEKVMSKIIPSGVKDLQLDVSILPNGIYSLLIKEGGKTVVKKIVITK